MNEYSTILGLDFTDADGMRVLNYQLVYESKAVAMLIKQVAEEVS